MTRFEVREASVADAAWLAAIHAASFGPGDAWPADVIETLLCAPGGFSLLHSAGGLVMARLAADEAEVLTLAVAPAARRRGIARCLLAATMARLRDAGASSLFLEVGMGNTAARRLYEAAGFRVVGNRVRYYDDGSDALIMRADLQSAGGQPG